MQSRYSEMMMWGISYLVFCYITFMILILFDKVFKKIVIVKKNNKIRVFSGEIIVAFLLVLLSGIRCNCGSDYYNYYLQSLNNSNWYSSLESIISSRFQNGLTILMFLSNKIFKSEYAIFFVVAFIIIIPTVNYINKRADNPIESIKIWMLLGYFLMTTNILKQAVSMVLIMYFYEYLYNKKYVSMAIVGIGALIFHTASLYVILILLFFNHIKFTPKKMLLITMVSVVVSILMKPFFSRLVALLPYQYAKYLSFFTGDSSIDIKLFIGGVIFSAFYIYITWKMLKSPDIFNDYSFPLVNLMVWCIPILILGFRVYLFNRIACYGLQFIILLLPIYIKSISKQVKHIYSVGLIVLCMCFSILCAENNYYHYGTIYTEEPMSVMQYSQKYQMEE